MPDRRGPSAPAGTPQQIQAYGGGAFRVSGIRFEGSILIYADRTVAWSASSIDGISAGAVSSLTREAAPGALVIIGCGGQFRPMPATLRQDLAAAGVYAEWMDTGAACRTFNVLVSDGREVRAALLVAD